MMTPYMNPYIGQMQPQNQMQDVGGLTPVFQNIANQQAMQNAALAQQNQLVNQAGQTVQGKQAGAAMNPIAMAMLLRQGSDPYSNAQTAMKQYGAENVYGYGGMGQVPTRTTGVD